MTQPLQEKSMILANESVGPNLYVMELVAPAIAQAVTPGQFIHVQLPGMEGHILRRPFSVYHCDQKKGTIEILYQVVGFGSTHMVSLGSNDCVDLIGPLGNGWKLPQDVKKVLLVAGGVGAAPLYLFVEQLLSQGVVVRTILGAQTESALVCRQRYDALLPQGVSYSTDDGSFGFEGFCTPLVEEELAKARYDFVACCGPEPLMKVVAALAQEADTECQISLERRMACGIGACLSCIVETSEGIKRSCVDGPVFDASQVVFG